MAIYVDIEAALAEELASSSAPPLPETFTESLPFALFTRVGGSMSDMVYALQSVSVDVYAATWASAQAAAQGCARAIIAMEGTTIGSGDCRTPIYAASCGAPYNNPDPLHPTVPRVTFLADLATRATD